MIRRLRNAVVTLIGLVILLALAGATYQAIETRPETHRSPEAGHLIDRGGYRLKIKCTGKGTPTVSFRNQIGQRDQSGDYIKTKAKNGTARS